MPKYSKAATDLLHELEYLLERYSDEPRKTTQPYYLKKVAARFPEYAYQPEDELVLETHMDHIGSLPVVATAFYPSLQDDKVDLGKSLIMLAIHDIGEIVTGDEMVFTKKAGSKERERKAALSLLNPYYHQYYDEVKPCCLTSWPINSALHGFEISLGQSSR